MSFIEHIKELRIRLITSCIAIIACSVLSFFFYSSIVKILYKPYMNLPGNTHQALYIMSLFEGFLVKIKVSILSGIIISSPLHIYNIVKFIMPALKRNEQKVLQLALFFGFFLVLCSVYYGYCYIMPVSIKFLTSPGFVPQHIGILLNFKNNIFYIIQFLLVCVIIFQMPIILVILLYMNIVSRKKLLSSGRYVIIGVFIFSAILTPPDFISQLAVALPLVVLYFITLIIAKVFKLGEE
jgi:sec-independent protein translocase protein TatC